MSLSIQPEIVDRKRRRAAIERLRQLGVRLPTWSELADPGEIEPETMPLLANVDPDSPDAANLWRTHWFNSPDQKMLIDMPGHIVLPPELTGVQAPIVVLLGSPLSNDWLAQGARGLCLSRAAIGYRTIRSIE